MEWTYIFDVLIIILLFIGGYFLHGLNSYVKSLGGEQGKIEAKLLKIDDLKQIHEEIKKIEHKFLEEIELKKASLSFSGDLSKEKLSFEKKVYKKCCDLSFVAWEIFDSNPRAMGKTSYNLESFEGNSPEETMEYVKGIISFNEKKISFNNKIIEFLEDVWKERYLMDKDFERLYFKFTKVAGSFVRERDYSEEKGDVFKLECDKVLTEINEYIKGKWK